MTYKVGESKQVIVGAAAFFVNGKTNALPTALATATSTKAEEIFSEVAATTQG